MAVTSDPDPLDGDRPGGPHLGQDPHDLLKEAGLTGLERSLNTVEQEFSRLVIGAREAIRKRAESLDPSLFPFDFKTMNALWHHAVRLPDTPSLTGKELADLLAVDKSVVSRSVKRLEECGLVARTVSTEDARVQLIHITRDGYHRFKRTAEDVPTIMLERLRTWDVESLDQLAELLHRINGPLPDQAPRDCSSPGT
ncbi:MarR family transcriptional regulator [Galactobacter sp.]|uniref:MarR family winged helix-turn-helix transcriptional regulator n=1 Tax=Galactobacter sp. TaxID=2676125 RepID=UPI0025C50E0E|nr:MarR family transcriptional regulator [Galactobacter sp.]